MIFYATTAKITSALCPPKKEIKTKQKIKIII